MNTLLASLLAFIGVASAAPPQHGIQTTDPRSILFSIPTLSDDIAPLEPVLRQPSTSDFVFHEDEWSQVEFFPKSQLREVQRLLTEYKPFEQAHRVQHGWREVCVRKVQRVPVLSGAQSIQRLEKVLGVKAGPAPMLFSSNAVTGRVKDGFSLPLGGNVTLYGYVGRQGIPILGAIVGRNPDDRKLTEAFIKLNSSDRLVLVDWRSQLVLVSVSATGQIEVWRP
jgi:hypothetical protein